MFEKIDEEIRKCCLYCKYSNQCKKYDCFTYRIKKIISSDDEITEINIDDFFEPENKNQISLFEIGDK